MQIAPAPALPCPAHRPAPSPYLDEAATAAFLGISRRTLQRYRKGGYGPPYRRVGPRMVRYPRLSLMDWLQKATEPLR